MIFSHASFSRPSPFTKRALTRQIAEGKLLSWACRGYRHAAHARRRAAAPAASSSPAIELIEYTPVKKGSIYDLRLYQPYTVAEAAYSRRDEGFLMLGEYLSGGNAAGCRMKETQPIVMCYFPEGHKRMRVQLTPKDPSLAGKPLPQPTDPAVSMEIAGGELVAVIRFEGNATPEVAEAMRKRLLAALEADGLRLAPAEAEGLFRIAQYGPMNSLQTRINELWLAVQLG